ncbi:MAG: biotin-dependent carboxyltransferase family protein [Firmicutes bacterium]|jgi:biotin-dependent carboxylase-like uncharacterized protein|nr:biotin-dependent carboxyltransferase family protein [Bacillota bacterium]
MKGLKIIEGGLFTTIQDGGRKGYLAMGITSSGAMDLESMKIANAIVGNDYDEGLLEITLMGPKIEFQCYSNIALTGANISAKINGYTVPIYQCLFVKPGDILTFGARLSGSRAYMAIRNGFKVDEVMASKSTNVMAAFGGFKGRKLQAGDFLEIVEESRNIRVARFDYRELYMWEDITKIRVVSASEEGRFTPEGLKTFYGAKYKVSNDSNRMGIRLSGKKIDHMRSADIISSPIAIGTVQVPENGQPIIMMSDRQTTGGYTRIATVISIDLPRVAQLVPGEEMSFETITVEEAQEIAIWRRSRIDFFIAEMEKRECEVKSTSNFNIGINGNTYSVMVQELEK